MSKLIHIDSSDAEVTISFANHPVLHWTAEEWDEDPTVLSAIANAKREAVETPDAFIAWLWSKELMPGQAKNPIDANAAIASLVGLVDGREEARVLLPTVCALLRGYGVHEMFAPFYGSGDDGTFAEIEYRDETSVDCVAVPVEVDDAVRNWAEVAIDPDFNNEGCEGDITIDVVRGTALLTMGVPVIEYEYENF